jgi:hypothetical protein
MSYPTGLNRRVAQAQQYASLDTPHLHIDIPTLSIWLLHTACLWQWSKGKHAL